MPTTDRRRQFIPRAVACYLAQTWQEKELVVVDDGAAPMWDLVQHVPGIVYLRYPPRMNVGRKRNIACEHSAGDVIAHWDDDDWSTPDRLVVQADRLLGTKKPLSGDGSLLFWDVRTNDASIYAGGKDYACGSTLMYRKDFWEQNRFLGVECGEDSNFVGRAARLGKLDVREDSEVRPVVIATIHHGNTSARSPYQWPSVPKARIPNGYFEGVACKQAS
ncbi:MAG TPA: glycosyltransferase family A protein [Clostridia bacterium]|nr:glycosyltransferase family A protein [Clostridia bacterium]